VDRCIYDLVIGNDIYKDDNMTARDMK